jgi:hypothetical protein
MKRMVHKTIEQFTARFIARGFSQANGLDYDKICLLI